MTETDERTDEAQEILVFEMRVSMPGLPEAYRDALTMTCRVGRMEPQDGRGYFMDVLKGQETIRVWHPLAEGDTDELAALNGVHSMSEGLVGAADAYIIKLAIKRILADVPVSQVTDALRGLVTEIRPVTADREKFLTGVNHANDN